MSLAHATLDFPLRDRIVYGRGRITELPHLVREAGGRHAFITTDPGVVQAGVAGRVRALHAWRSRWRSPVSGTASRLARRADRRLRRQLARQASRFTERRAVSRCLAR